MALLVGIVDEAEVVAVPELLQRGDVDVIRSGVLRPGVERRVEMVGLTLLTLCNTK